MTGVAAARARRGLSGWLPLAVLALALTTSARAQDAGTALRERYASLREALGASPLQRPIVIESQQSSSQLTGRVFAVIDQPFARLGATLPTVAVWCDILMLHLNNKQCQLSAVDGRPQLAVYVARRYDQPLANAHRIDFVVQPQAQSASYVEVALIAAKGPLGTHDYRIRLEAMPLDGNRSFIQLSYSYEFGITARLAMQAFLATAGREKIGFTVVERKPSGQPVYVGSLRGLVERNTMRYYLAIEAYLGSLNQPGTQQLEHRLRHWFVATERFAPQLHELDEGEYLEMKRRELRR